MTRNNRASRKNVTGEEPGTRGEQHAAVACVFSVLVKTWRELQANVTAQCVTVCEGNVQPMLNRANLFCTHKEKTTSAYLAVTVVFE